MGHGDVHGTIEEKKEEDRNLYRYKTIDGVITESESKPQLRRRYRKNAIRDRMRLFAQDMEDYGFVAGNVLTERDLEYWIIALDLAHDKLTIKQYFQRLVIAGYFIIKNFNKFVFCGSQKPGQLSLMDPKLIRAKLHGLLKRDKRIKRVR